MKDNKGREILDGTPRGNLDTKHIFGQDETANQEEENKTLFPDIDDNDTDSIYTDDSNDEKKEYIQPEPTKELEAKVFEAMKKIIDLKSQRTNINAEISSVVQDLEAEGINRHAFKFALRFYEMAPEQREGLDFGYTFARKAIGQPLQQDLFDVNETTH